MNTENEKTTLTNTEIRDLCAEISEITDDSQIGWGSFNESAKKIMKNATVSRFSLRKLAKSTFKKKKFESLPRMQIETLTRALDMCIKKVADYIFPNDGNGLYE